MNIDCTPNSQLTKKRELTSPEFDIENKKNRYGSNSSESSLDSSVETVNLNSSVVSHRDKDMASGSEPSTSETLMESEPSPNTTQSTTASASHITIPPSEMQKIAEMLKATFQGEIVSIVDSVVKGVLSGLQDRISSLEKSNSELINENRSLITRITALEAQADQAEQYSRRNCLRISGVKEETNESTDDIVMKIASDIGSDIQLENIDRSHRIGNPNRRGDKPREIIVKFTAYRYRSKFYKQRTRLKEQGYTGVFINEDLTKRRSSLLFEARTLFKSKLIKGSWSSDGIVLIKDNQDRVHRVSCTSDLDPFRPPMTGRPVS